MQVLLLILVAAVMLPETGDPPVGRVTSISIVLGAIAVIALLGGGHALVLRRGLDRVGALGRLERANTTMRWMQRLAVFVVVIGILLLGFREAVRSFVGDPPLLDEAITVAPALVAITISWWIFHPFEQRSQDSMLLRRLDEGLPVQAPPGRAAFVAMQVRSQLLVLLVPFAMLVLGGESIQALTWDETDAGSWIPSLAAFGVIVSVALVAPAIIVRLVGARPLPDGEVRTALEEMCRRTGVRVRNILVWPTGGLVVNAAVTGLVAPLRWVMLTDGLLESLRREEVLAVMAHELGHVRRQHMPWMAASVVALAMGASVILDPAIEAARTWRWELGGDVDATILDLGRIDLAGTVVVLVLVMIGFGWVSRRFERQADAFAAICLSGHGSDRPDSDAAVASAAVGAMSSALATVSEANGVSPERFTWRHGSIASRRRHLRSLIGMDAARLPIDGVVSAVKIASIVGLLTASAWWWGGDLLLGRASPSAGEVAP